jgi:uncharacterized membrane protein
MPEKIVEHLKKEVEETRTAFKEKMVTFILAGFGLVASLAWNEAIKSLVDTLLPKKTSALIGKFIYAILITFVVVFISRYLEKISTKE